MTAAQIAAALGEARRAGRWWSCRCPAHDDRSPSLSLGAGERAARTAAARWLAEARRVLIAMPPEPGTDMADVLAGRGHAAITELRDAAA